MENETRHQPEDHEPTEEELDAEDEYWANLPWEEHVRIHKESEPAVLRSK